ncbi:hypothetical protein NSQ26_04555 [Bacillus sp. FSL W7-1360]
MKMQEVEQLLNATGKHTECRDGRLMTVPLQHENYYLLLEGDGGEWVYCLAVQDRTNQPYMENVEVFSTVEEGSRFFFLKQLAEQSFEQMVVAFSLENKDLNIGSQTFNKQQLEQAFSTLGMPAGIFYDDEKPSGRGIVLEKNEGDYVVSFYGKDGQKVHSTLPVTLDLACFFAFQQTCLLYLFEKAVPDLLKRENIDVTFTDEDVKHFIF